jgi:hypothetical protein
VGDFLLGDVMGKLIEVMLAHFLDELLREVMDALRWGIFFLEM